MPLVLTKGHHVMQSSPLERFNQAWEDSTIQVVFNAESDIYFVNLTNADVRRATQCKIPQVFAASSYEAMLLRASEHGYCFEQVY